MSTKWSSDHDRADNPLTGCGTIAVWLLGLALAVGYALAVGAI